MQKIKKKVWERIVPLEKADREWDIQFWQSQSPSARFNVTWGLVDVAYKLKGKRTNAASFRLRRTVEHIKQA